MKKNTSDPVLQEDWLAAMIQRTLQTKECNADKVLQLSHIIYDTMMDGMLRYRIRVDILREEVYCTQRLYVACAVGFRLPTY